MKELVEAEVECMESQRRELSRHIGAPVGLDSLVSYAAGRYNVPKEKVYSTRGEMRSVYARRLVWAILASEGLTIKRIARVWGTHESTIGHGVKNARRSQAKAIAKYFQLHKAA